MKILQSLNDPLLADLLISGHVGVMPTDTIYGLAASASSPDAVRRLTELKGGAANYSPGTVVAASVQQLIDLGVDESTVKQVEHLWPNPLSIELPINESLTHLYQDGPHRAFRVVANPELAALLEKTGPLLTTSANLHGEPPANNPEEAMKYFEGRVDFCVEGGDLSGRPPSTVARFKDGRLEVLRQGAVKINEDGRVE